MWASASRTYVFSASFAHLRTGRVLSRLKTVGRVADNFLVRQWGLITALGVALSAQTLAGTSEWDSDIESAADTRASSVSLAPAGSELSRMAAVLPALPALPETSDHLPAGPPAYTIHRDIPEVLLRFTVADEQGRAVRNITSQEVRVFDNQTQVPRFSQFERDDDLPLQLGLLLDTSDSAKRVLPDEKAAATKFLDRIMRPQMDSAFVVAFGGDVKMWQGPTADRQKLFEAIERLQEPGWGTRFYDALYSACDSRLASSSNQLLHRALVVLSDGDDTQSLRGLRDVIAIAQRSEIQIYGLMIRDNQPPDRGDLVLQRLADATGGRIYVARSSQDLGGAFAQIEQDLRTQYFVSFPPQQPTPGFHSLRVEVRAPYKLQVHARQGYYAAVR